MCEGCATTYEVEGGVPVLVAGNPPRLRYYDDPDVYRLLEQFGHYHNVSTFADPLLADPGVTDVLSVGEGSGEYALALARKHPGIRIAAFDLDRARVVRGERLRQLLNVPNVWFCVADAFNLPYIDGAFQVAYERGVYHILPGKDAHLRELSRVGPTAILMTEMANGWMYGVNWVLFAVLARLFGVGSDLSSHRATIEHLKRIGAYSGWRRYVRDLEQRGFVVEPIFHDVFIKRSYHRRYPGLIAKRSARFGLLLRRSATITPSDTAAAQASRADRSGD